MSKKDILESISPEEALAILRQLVASNQTVRKRAERIAWTMLTEVDTEEVAGEVFMALDSLQVEDVWGISGSTRDGYVDTGTCAWGMVEEALAPMLRQLYQCQALSLKDAAKTYCMGILQGIYEFETTSNSEFKNWAVDAPAHYFVSTYKDWKKQAKNKKDIAEVQRFIKDIAPEWETYCK